MHNTIGARNKGAVRTVDFVGKSPNIFSQYAAGNIFGKCLPVTKPK